MVTIFFIYMTWLRVRLGKTIFNSKLIVKNTLNRLSVRFYVGFSLYRIVRENFGHSSTYYGANILNRLNKRNKTQH